MKKDFREKLLNDPALSEDSPNLLRYREVKKITSWKSNGTIRRLVNEGKLERRRVAPHVQGLRITRQSLTAYLASLNDEDEARKVLGKTPGEWKALKEAKAREDAFGKLTEEQAASNGTVVPEEKITRTSAGAFASPVTEYVDVLSGRLIPIGCYLDETDSLVCGLLDPFLAERILRHRMYRRGIRSSDGNVRYHAQLVSTACDAQMVGSNPTVDRELAEYSLKIRRWFAERKQS